MLAVSCARSFADYLVSAKWDTWRGTEGADLFGEQRQVNVEGVRKKKKNWTCEGSNFPHHLNDLQLTYTYTIPSTRWTCSPFPQCQD